jgi:hypothetical protein
MILLNPPPGWGIAGLALLLTSVVMGPARGQTEVALVQPHGESLIYEIAGGYEPQPKGGLTEQFVSGGITFNISYGDVGAGFADPDNGEAMRRRLEDVLAYVASVINFTGRTLDIQILPSETDGTGALASAGTFYPVSAGIHGGSTLRRLSTGLKPFDGFPEISVTVDVGFPWNISAAAPAANESDFFSVLLHEITHGLGFTSLIEEDGTSALGPGVYTTFDSFLTEGAMADLLIQPGFLPVFQVDPMSIISDDVWFGGSQAVSRYGLGTSVPVYAPNPYEPGSSTSHWDIDVLQGPSVMPHALILGTAQREYAPVDLGALIDLGYNQIVGAPEPAPGGCAPPAAKNGSTSAAGGDGLIVLIAGLTLVASRRRRASKGARVERIETEAGIES